MTTTTIIVDMNGQQAIERIVTGLGYDLVDVERAARGLLRVTIDRIPGHVYPVRHAAGADDAAGQDRGEFVTVEDCERVTRQLQLALEVDGVDYARLEVSSPGLDRPLRRETDFQRFAGLEVAITLKLPFQGRKVWRGVLQPAGEPGAAAPWRLVLRDDKGKGADKGMEKALDFRFDEVRDARLVPVVDFKGRTKPGDGRSDKSNDAAASPAAGRGAAAGVNGGLDR